MLVIRK